MISLCTLSGRRCGDILLLYNKKMKTSKITRNSIIGRFVLFKDNFDEKLRFM